MVSHATHKLQVTIIMILIPIAIFYGYTHVDMYMIRSFFLPAVPTMHIRDIPFEVEIANSEAERVQGLSGRQKLSESAGLLFVFPESEYHTIWMKDMNFPIDIIWIDEDLKVVGIDKNVSPDTYPRIFRPSRPVKYILETNIHFSDTYSFREGDVVKLPLKYLED